MKHTKSENVFNVINIAFFVVLSVVMIYPFINAIAISFSDNIESASKIVTIFPVGFTLDNYSIVFARSDIMKAFFISVVRTLIGIATHLVITGLAAYGMSIKTLPFRRTIVIIAIIPMYLSAGIIPTFVNIYELGLFNKFIVYILPAMFATYNMLIMRTFYEGIPYSLTEAAHIDGASPLRIFIKIIVPLSKPVIATIALFAGVHHWNSWFDANLYVPSTSLHPLSMLLRRILFDAELTDPSAAFALSKKVVQISPQGIKMATLVVATLPILCVYPFCQKYFIRGVMIGAVKG